MSDLCHVLMSVEKSKLDFCSHIKGTARTQFPAIKNYTPELPAFGVIADVSPAVVQWKSLNPGYPPD